MFFSIKTTTDSLLLAGNELGTMSWWNEWSFDWFNWIHEVPVKPTMSPLERDQEWSYGLPVWEWEVCERERERGTNEVASRKWLYGHRENLILITQCLHYFHIIQMQPYHCFSSFSWWHFLTYSRVGQSWLNWKHHMHFDTCINYWGHQTQLEQLLCQNAMEAEQLLYL